MIGEIIGILIVVFIIVFPLPKFLIKHAFDILKYATIDGYYYFKHKEYNRCLCYGKISITSAYRNKVFGSGKTLDISKRVHDIFTKYDGLPVWDDDLQDFVIQRIHIVSNITFKDIPYTPFVTSRQLMNVEQPRQDVTIFVFDEVGAIWNSRDFKTNISTELLRNLLQVRKTKIGIIGTAQRFRFCDALLRQITGSLYCVNKFWRIIKIREYDPFDFENCTNQDMLKPLHVSYSWVSNQDYAAYDTDERVERLSNEDMLPDEQILANQGVNSGEMDAASHLKKRFRRRGRR